MQFISMRVGVNQTVGTYEAKVFGNFKCFLFKCHQNIFQMIEWIK